MGYMENGLFDNESDVCLPLKNIWGDIAGYSVLCFLNPSETLNKPRKLAISFVLTISSGMCTGCRLVPYPSFLVL